MKKKINHYQNPKYICFFILSQINKTTYHESRSLINLYLNKTKNNTNSKNFNQIPFFCKYSACFFFILQSFSKV